MPASIRIYVAKKIVTKLTSAARAVFPKESFAALLGTKCEDGDIYIKEIWIPPSGIIKTSNRYTIDIPDIPLSEGAFEAADDAGMKVLGGWHSHTEEFDNKKSQGLVISEACNPSRGDWAEGWDNVQAITAIYRYRDTGKFQTRTAWFGPVVRAMVYRPA